MSTGPSSGCEASERTGSSDSGSLSEEPAQRGVFGHRVLAVFEGFSVKENGFGCAGQTRISNPDFLVVLLVVGPVRGSGVLLRWGPLLPFSRRRFWLGLSPAPASLLQAFHWILSSFIFVHAITSQLLGMCGNVSPFYP